MGDLLRYTMTKPGIMLYPTVITPKAFGIKPKPDAKKSYSISFIFDADHPDVTGMKKQLILAAQGQWPGLNISEEVKGGKLKMPFTTGDRMIEKRNKKRAAAGKAADDRMDFLKGKIIFRASSDFPVALGVRIKGEGDVDVTDANKGVHQNAFYSGCLGLGAFSFRPYEAIKDEDKPGVKTYLDMVFSLNTGTRFAIGGKSAAETFKGVAGTAVQDDPTGGLDMDDEMPF